MIETLLTNVIGKTLDYARSRRSCVLIQGKTGRGKTVAVKAWSARKRNVYYIDCPPDGGAPALVATLVEATGAPSAKNVDAWLAGQKATLILDECARLIPAKQSRAPRALEWLRRMHDTHGIALAFVATDIFIKECEKGNIGLYLEQFVGRFRDKCIIPDYVSPQEVSDILKGFIPGDEPDGQLVDWAVSVANEPGRGGARRLWWLMEDASDIAKANKLPMDLKFLQAVLHDYEGKERLPGKPKTR